jgi:hypothetical protein
VYAEVYAVREHGAWDLTSLATVLPIRHLVCAENTGFKKHLHGWIMWGEGGWSDRTAKVYAEVSSLKTSAIALHAVVFVVHEAPCRTGRSSKGQLQQQLVT